MGLIIILAVSRTPTCTSATWNQENQNINQFKLDLIRQVRMWYISTQQNDHIVLYETIWSWMSNRVGLFVYFPHPRLSLANMHKGLLHWAYISATSKHKQNKGLHKTPCEDTWRPNFFWVKGNNSDTLSVQCPRYILTLQRNCTIASRLFH